MVVVELVERLSGWNQLDFASRVQAGDRAALREVYERTHQRLHRFALAMSGDGEMAADALQETFVTLVHRPELYDPRRGTIEAYLYGVLRNRLRELRRKARDHHREFDWEDCEETGDDTLLEGIERRFHAECVKQAVLALPSHYREVVLLVELEECSYDEASEILGLPVGTIRSRLNRARGLLEKKLKEFQEVAR